MKYTLFFVITTLSLFSCNSPEEKINDSREETSKTIRVFAQDRPGGEAFEFDMPSEKGLDYLSIVEKNESGIDEDDLVLGLEFSEKPIAIPIRYLSGFEVANVKIEDAPYLVTWCPLVGTARLFNGSVNGDTSGFDFGWGLVNDNLLIVDRKTKSVWSQLSCEALTGPLKGEKLESIPTIQTTWTFWKTRHPDTKVAINKDTSNAPFPAEVFRKDYYLNFIPGQPSDRKNVNEHDISDLGLGIEMEEQQLFFPLVELQKMVSPLHYREGKAEFSVYFNLEEHTAWAEKRNGELMQNTMVYKRAWLDFHPNSKIFTLNSN